jgi:hypothetical protein
MSVDEGAVDAAAGAAAAAGWAAEAGWAGSVTRADTEATSALLSAFDGVDAATFVLLTAGEARPTRRAVAAPAATACSRVPEDRNKFKGRSMFLSTRKSVSVGEM